MTYQKKHNNNFYDRRGTLIYEPHMTLAEIADIMGMSRERVRQIEQRALGKMKKILASKGISAESFISTLRYTKPIKHNPDAPDSEYELMYDKEEDDGR